MRAPEIQHHSTFYSLFWVKWNGWAKTRSWKQAKGIWEEFGQSAKSSKVYQIHKKRKGIMKMPMAVLDIKFAHGMEKEKISF